MFLLPPTLIAVLLALPLVLGQTSPNDLFRQIALQVLQQPDPPICCLKPSSPLEAMEEELLLSFEEWKAKQSVVKAQVDAKLKESNAINHSVSFGGEVGNRNETTNVSSGTSSQQDGSSTTLEDSMQGYTNEPVSPHFRVPLTDRFNYANSDCSARVHLSHRSAKSPSSILSSKRDRYMLSPCKSTNNEPQFVVVELCEDIRIDTVQLANFEFFSGVFKEFTVSVAKTTALDGWTNAGTYRAKNVRGVQSFHPPTSLRDFYRYIRIDFLSNYGNEFYCPISLLRVYGLTHLEQWKWDIWEAESRAKQMELEKVSNPHIREAGEGGHSGPVFLPEPSPTSVAEIKETSNEAIVSLSAGSQDNVSSLTHVSFTQAIPTISKTSNSPPPAITTGIELTTRPNLDNRETSIKNTDQINTHVSTPLSLPEDILPSTEIPSSPSTVDTHIRAKNNDTPTVSVNAKTDIQPTMPTPKLNPPAPPAASASSSLLGAVSVPSAVNSAPIVPPVIGSPSGGESIYRTIMNRLAAIELNHTLYAQYIEQQNSAIRDVIKRIGEDVGRLEGIGRAQQSMYQKTSQEWNRQRQQLLMDYGELISRVEYLSDEIILERRLGVAQLCLLLAVLIFMGLTRGSRGFMEQAPVNFNRSMREWGKRHLNFSGDWTSRYKSNGQSRSLSPSMRPGIHAMKIKPSDNGSYPLNKVEFPAEGMWKQEPYAFLPLNLSRNNFQTRARSGSRPRTPSLRSTGVRRNNGSHVQLPRPTTPTRSIVRPPMLHRSSSQGTNFQNGWPGSGPRSAKKWARTAHLHEIRSAHRNMRLVDDENAPLRRHNGSTREIGDVFSNSNSPFMNFKTPASLKRKGATKRVEDDPWEDINSAVGSDIDMDV